MKRVWTMVITVSVLAFWLWIAVLTQDMSRIALLLRSMRASLYFVFLLLTIIAAACGSTNLFLLLRVMKKSPRWRRVFELDLLSFLGTYYTPGGSGGLAFLVYMLKKEGVSPEDSASCLLVDKIITATLAVVSLLFLISLRTGREAVSIDTRKLVLLCIGLICLFLLLWLLPALRRFSLRLLAGVIVFRRYPGILLVNLAITGVTFCLNSTQFLLAFTVIHAPSPAFSRILVAYGPLALLGYVPFTIAGAGITEAAAVALWKSPNVSSEEIITALFVARVFTLASSLLIPAFIYAKELWRTGMWNSSRRGLTKSSCSPVEIRRSGIQRD